LADLAASLNNWSIDLREVGREDEGAEAGEEAQWIRAALTVE
jgi:hypothetical protein